MIEPTTVLEDPFELVSVGRVEMPSGTEGAGWHRYVIRQGSNEIRGYRQGTLDTVTSAAEHIVIQLNERRSSRGRRVQIVLRGRRPKKS